LKGEEGGERESALDLGVGQNERMQLKTSSELDRNGIQQGVEANEASRDGGKYNKGGKGILSVNCVRDVD